MNTSSPVTPVNVKLFDTKKEIMKSGMLPVTSQFIFDPVTKEFHPDGLFSEVIFGQVGTKDRFTRFGYIDLKTRILHPQIHNNLISMRSVYSDIMKGKVYAKMDPEVGDLMVVSEEEGSTGFTFFMESLPKIKFKSTDSRTRDDKINILQKYKENIYLDGVHFVLPCITRDIRLGDKVEMEAINKLYLNLISLTMTLPEGDAAKLPIFDGIKCRIQDTANAIFEYIFNLISGKGGFARGRVGARNIALGTRNVVTSAPLTEVDSPDDPKYFKNDELMLPLYQAAKSTTPIVAHHLLTAFFNPVFTGETIPLIDPNDLSLSYVEPTSISRDYFTTIDGAVKFIDLCSNEEIRKSPVKVKGTDKKDYFMYLVYDQGDTIYLLRNLSELTEGLIPKVDLTQVDPYPFNIYYDIDTSLILRKCDYLDPDIKRRGFIRREDIGKAEVNGFTRSNDRWISDKLILDVIDKTDNYEEVDEHVFVVKMNNELVNYLIKSKESKYRHVITWVKKRIFDKDLIRPMTYGEMLYVATEKAVNGKYSTSTRYPILNDVGILTPKIHLLSTEKCRSVKFRNSLDTDIFIYLRRYPIIISSYQESMCPHSSTLPGYDGDFDGDMFGAIPFLTNEANEEIKKYHDGIGSIVNTSRELYRGLGSDDMVKYTLFSMSYTPKGSLSKDK